MKQRLTYLALITLIFLLFGGAIYMEASIWQECRKDHSLLYCIRVLFI